MRLQTNIRFYQKTAMAMVFLLSFQAGFPVAAWALTSGPSQPEFSSFEPVGTTQMVDLFSGDFVYNIPLFELPGPDGGYPFNLAYHSGVTMDQEASWVGLGWTLNSGAINRTMRGLPDDFNGVDVKRKTDMKPNETWGFGVTGHAEFWGYEPAKNIPGSAIATLSLKTSHNNYRGWSVGFDLGLSSNNVNQTPFAFNGGLNMGFNSQDGASLSPTLSLAHTAEEFKNAFSISGSINSREGLTSVGLGYNRSEVKEEKLTRGNGKTKDIYKTTKNHGKLNANYSFGRVAYSPQVDVAYRGRNFSGSIEAGGWTAVANLGGAVNVNFDRQRLKRPNIWTSAKAFGFFHLRDRLSESEKDDALMDFNREKDGPIRQNTPNLAAPITTPDIYSVVGQGIGGSYRAFRSDVGILTDPYAISESSGGVAGLELGFASGFDLGGDLGGNWAVSKSKRWDTSLEGELGYDNDKLNKNYEPYYFKAAGELTAENTAAYDNIGKEKAVRWKLFNKDIPIARLLVDTDNVLEYADGTVANTLLDNNPTINPPLQRTERKPRSNSLQPITNAELKAGGENAPEALKEYKISYFNTTNDSPGPYLSTNPNDSEKDPNQPYLKERNGVIQRSTTDDEKDQIAGITALHPGGMRYVYGLPVKNLVQREYVFSVDDLGESDCTRTKDIIPTTATPPTIDYKKGSDNYLNETEVPSYTHAHLLTAVLGADYVDLDGIDGPSDGDYGYWVKFNYVKTADGNNPYRWKAPFEGANFMQGSRNDTGDGKGSFMYGEREQYYLATAETRTHLAVFDLQKRADGHGVSKELQNTGEPKGEASYLLHKIRLYSKLELLKSNAKPIKTVYFEYDYSLCQGVHNNDDSYSHLNHNEQTVSNQGGKLTLKKLWFTYEDSDRGSLSPYQFFYPTETNTTLSGIPPFNPNYNPINYDRWGNFQEYPNDCYALNHPYTNQGEISNEKIADRNASAWHLTEIQLPSGASIKVDYESDDYAYVQDRTAMEMFKIEGIKTIGDDILNTGYIANESTSDNPTPLMDEDRKIYFDLGSDYDQLLGIEPYLADLHRVPLFTSATQSEAQYEWQIFYKILIEIKDNSNEKEYVSGYAVVEEYPDGKPKCGIDNGKGWLQLKPTALGKENDDKRYYHPFCAAAWQKLKMEYSDRLNDTSLDSYDEKSFGEAVSAMGSAIGEVKNLFKNFYSQSSGKMYSNDIDLANSFIRLNTPDKEKEGGGSRVKKIKLYDNWNIGEDLNTLNDEVTYGQVFEYRTDESYTDWNGIERNRNISSGVAINEPGIGGEESALRYARNWVQGVATKTAENLFFEYPINESYYPGSGVGYSKVTVKSLATHLAINPNDVSQPNAELPSGFGTTGVTVNEFYTAKDFPVLVEETPLDSRIQPPRWMPFGVGTVTSELYSGTQGYSIILNDMHGKAYKVSHYGMDGSANVLPDKINEVTYTYSINDKIVHSSASNKEVSKSLNNEVDVLISDAYSDPNGNAVVETKELGVDYEFFVDTRENTSNSGSAYVGINGDYTPLVIFGISFWPNLNLNTNQTRTIVTNKIVHKSGILLQTEAYDGQSHITTTNKVFDPLTGEPLLTTVNNSFDDPVYNYSIPARLAYEGMGAAYENWGLTFDGNMELEETCGFFRMNNISSAVEGKLIPGDECIIVDGCEAVTDLCNAKKFTYVGKIENNHLFENHDLDIGLTGVDLTLMIIRSGKRNHLSAKAGSITALSDPTMGRSSSTPSVALKIPLSATNTQTTSATLNVRTIDNVLSASAVTYSDTWDLERGGCDNKTIVKKRPPVAGEEGQSNCHCLVTVQNLNTHPLDCNPNYSITYSISGTQYTQNLTCANSDIDINNLSGLCYLQNVEDNITSCEVVVCSLEPIENVQVEFEDPSGENLDACQEGNPQEDGVSFLPCWQIIPGSITDCGGDGVYVNVPVTISTEHFSLGEKGIWRPYQNYSYVTDRNPGNTEVNYNLATDGVFNGLPLFDWKDPFSLKGTSAKKWKKTNEITKYGVNGEESENRDIIGLYSTALYGYNYNVPIAVASNAGHYEVGFEGFEEYPIAEGLEGNIQSDGNIDFLCNDQSEVTSQSYNIVGTYYQGSNYVWFDKAYYEGAPLPSIVEMRLQDRLGNLYTLTAKATVMEEVSSAGIPFKDHITGMALTQIESCGLPSNQPFSGTINLKYCNICDSNNPPFSSSKMYLTGAVAHTGSQSLAVEAVFGSYTIPQKTLQLVKGKKYVVSAWVHRPAQAYTFDNGTIKVGLKSNGSVVNMPPAGAVIEGWQRIEGVITYNGDDQDLSLVIQTGGGVAYFDDFRIYPQDGSLQTYVYDPQDYRLRAVLDQNNYATFYHYDEEGNLVVVKKETERGIKTIQETRGYVKSNF